MFPQAASGRRSSRPRLEQLETRLVPAPMPGGLTSFTLPPAPLGLSPGGADQNTITSAPSEVDVTVSANAGPAVYDLHTVLAGWEGWQYHDPPGLVVTGNTNRALVTPRLAANDLQLTFAAGQSGTARVTVNLRDAAGAFTEVTFVITVRPALVVAGARAPSLSLPSGPSPLAH